MNSNVSRLHEEVFGQVGYKPTQTVLDINERIKALSGDYGNE
ncbi:MAG: hypothetical protein RR626_08130 [Anaerovoracaceae bacterium]